MQTLINGVNAIAGLPAELRARLNSDDPAVRGEALVDVITLGTGGAVLTTGATRLTLNATQQAAISRALAKAEAEAVAKTRVEIGARAEDAQQYDHFRSTTNRDSWDWQRQAPNNGAVPGTQQTGAAQVGQTLDRYGSRNGEYMSPSGTLYEARALPPGKRADPYEQYSVLRPFTVVQEEIAPAFGQSGGGLQMRARIPEVQNRFATIDELIRFNYLKDPKQ